MEGATLNWGLVSRGLVDEIYTFIGNIIIGGGTAPTLWMGKDMLKKSAGDRLSHARDWKKGLLLGGKPQIIVEEQIWQ